MLVKINRIFLEYCTVYKIPEYDIELTVPYTEISNEAEGRIIRILKRKVEEALGKDIRFEISTCEKN